MRLLFVTLLATTNGFRVPLGNIRMKAPVSDISCAGKSDDIRDAPGDPSLILTTSATIDDKPGFVAAASKAVASCLSKPETYVAICVTDKHEGMSFGGTTDPCAVGCVYSIGQINQENNGALTKAISELLEKYGVPNNRIYINFFDVPRANCGWSGRTFAG